MTRAPVRHPPLDSDRLVQVPGIGSLLVAVVACLGGVTAAADPETPRPDRHPELKRLSPKEDVWIDLRGKRVVVGGEIAIDKGPIEFFACPEGTKEHESIVAARATARLVHTALLAIGLVPGKPVSFDPEYVAASGPVVRIVMRWRDAEGKDHDATAQQWVRDTRSRVAMKEHWVFAGSSFWTDPADGKEYYQADGGDLVCLSNFPTAMLDLPIESSQSNEALLFEAFDGRIPPRGTVVDMILTPAAPRPAPASPAPAPSPADR